MIRSVGLLKTTLLDYPGKVAATLFTHGCSLRCPYCHNPELVAGPIPEHFLPVDQALSVLHRRRHVLEGVCITGGEPLLHKDIRELIVAIRLNVPAIKIDTSGTFPDRLEELMSEGIVDYVAMDLKTAPKHYDRVRGDGEAVRRSLAILRSSGVEYELRTTAAPGVVTSEDVGMIADVLDPRDRYVLTQFRPTKTLDPDFMHRAPYSDQVLRDWCQMLQARGLSCSLRGVVQDTPSVVAVTP